MSYLKYPLYCILKFFKKKQTIIHFEQKITKKITLCAFWIKLWNILKSILGLAVSYCDNAKFHKPFLLKPLLGNMVIYILFFSGIISICRSNLTYKKTLLAQRLIFSAMLLFSLLLNESGSAE